MTDNELLLAISDIMEKKLEPVRTDIKELKIGVKNLESKMTSLELKVDNLESRVTSLELKVDNLESRVTSLESSVQRLESSVQRLDSRMTKLEKRVTKLELHIENVTDKNVQLLVENYMPAAKKYETETAKIGSMQMDIEIIKDVVREHSERFELIS